jgi:two-component system response regulator
MNAYRILVADDNHDHALLTVDVLGTMLPDAEIRVARDGRETLGILFDEEWVPQLLLLDIQMPFANGFEVLERLKADDRLRLIPVVMLTTSSDDRDVYRSYGLGSERYVTKPVNAAALREIVSQIPSYRR